MTVELTDGVELTDEQSPPSGEASSLVEWKEFEASLAEAAQTCASLEEITSFKGEITLRTEKETGSWSLEDCVNRVLDIRDEASCARSRLRLTALASTVHLPGKLKLEAMERAQLNDMSALAGFVDEALREEGRRRLALKALAGLGD